MKFLKQAIKCNRKRIKVWYSNAKLLNYPKGTITIYAKEYSEKLPEELNPENETNSQTDYFDKDKARITPDNKYYEEVKKAGGQK